MFDARTNTSGRSATLEDDSDVATTAPGRATRAQPAEPDEPLFDGGAEWEDITPEEGERMTRGLVPAPDVAPERDQRGGAVAASTNGVPSSAYATSHGKEMRNYRYRPGTTITNTTDDANGDFGRPNTNQPKKVKKKYKAKVLKTVSVDIGTVVGGTRPSYLDGWVLVFHKTYVKTRSGKRKKVNSGDHTGWIRVRQLADKAIAKLAKHQDLVRAGLESGPGAGHEATLIGGDLGFSVENNKMLTGKKRKDYFPFRIQGGSGSTPLGNYTLRPKSYGNVIIGVWNPPGSGSGGKRFGGSGGIRAFFPLDTKFRLADVGPMTVFDETGQGKSTWRYVGATLNGEQIFCWLLQSWTTPKGDGKNF